MSTNVNFQESFAFITVIIREYCKPAIIIILRNWNLSTLSRNVNIFLAFVEISISVN